MSNYYEAIPQVFQRGNKLKLTIATIIIVLRSTAIITTIAHPHDITLMC